MPPLGSCRIPKMETHWVGKKTGVALIICHLIRYLSCNLLLLSALVWPPQLPLARGFHVCSTDSYLPEQLLVNTAEPLTPATGFLQPLIQAAEKTSLLPFWPFPQSEPPPPPPPLLLCCGGGGGRWAGEISLGGIPVWVFLGLTWVAEDRQWKSLSTLLNKGPVWAMAVFHITLISVSLSFSLFICFFDYYYYYNYFPVGKNDNRQRNLVMEPCELSTTSNQG